MVVKKNDLVEKRNILNELRSNNMTLQELRFFSIYLSKINARDTSTRVVSFPVENFRKIMEIDKVLISHLKDTTSNLLSKVVSVNRESGGYNQFQLFKECEVEKNENGEWYVQIDCHDKALPYLFEFKEKYFTYHLWNALRLKSSNQLRMYEILKQYEKIGEREIALQELRVLIGIGKDEYPRWGNFKTRVLDSCQQALLENTDIQFTYEPIKRGHGGKIVAIKFFISKNENYIDQLTLDEFIDAQPETFTGECRDIKDDELEGQVNFDSIETSNLEHIESAGVSDGEAPAGHVYENQSLEDLAGACNNEFCEAEMEIINGYLVKLVPFTDRHRTDNDRYDYLLNAYRELNLQANRKARDKDPIKNRFAYLKKTLEAKAAKVRDED